MVDITFYGTVYNSVKYIRRSLKSLAQTVLELQQYGITAEIVIVDNYSDDGTWEVMNEVRKEYNEKGVTIRLARLKCSRGLGREIAFKISKGKYLFFISDLDMEYNPYKLAEIIDFYIKNKNIHDKCLYVFLVPQVKAFNAGGFRDLNRAEDIEFGGRLIKKSLCHMLPVIDGDYKLVSFNEFMKPIDYIAQPKFFVSTFVSERRYVKNLWHYIAREVRNKIDMICGMGYTPKKIILEALFLHKLRGLKLLIWIFYHIVFYVLAVFSHKKISNNHYYINNGSLCDVAMFLNYLALIMNLVKNNEIKNLNFYMKYLMKFLKMMVRVKL